MTFSRDVRIIGLGARWQLDWGGRTSLGLLGVSTQVTQASLTLSNLTLLNLPSVNVKPPYGDFPWSLSTMFVWSALTYRYDFTFDSHFCRHV